MEAYIWVPENFLNLTGKENGKNEDLINSFTHFSLNSPDTLVLQQEKEVYFPL